MRVGRAYPATPRIKHAISILAAAAAYIPTDQDDDMEFQISTAATLPIFLALSSDHVTGATSKALTITLKKNGATSFSSITPTVTETGGGCYDLALTASHLDTAGPFQIQVTASGCDLRPEKHKVVNDVVLDTVGGANAITLYANNGTTLAAAAYLSRLDTALSLLAKPSDVPTSAANAAGLLDLTDGVETGLTVRQALRGVSAVSLGKLSGGGTATQAYRNAVADTQVRITATVDSNGNWLAVSYALT